MARATIGLLLFGALIAAFAADAKDPWSKVQTLKTGTELRIIKSGAAAPIMAQFAELTDDHLVVVVNNEQIAIPRERVSRIDSRQEKGYVTPESKARSASGGSREANPNVPNASPSASTAYSTGVAIRDKIPYETIYRRGAVTAKAGK